MQKKERVDHIVVVQPGFLGRVWHVELLRQLNTLPNTRAVVARSSHPVWWLPAWPTLYGVDACGEALAAEVRALVGEARREPPVTVSFLGQSLGGLIVRHAARLLWPPPGDSKKNAPVDAVPGVFVTLGTPHLGVDIRLQPWYKRWAFRALTAIGCVPATARQLADSHVLRKIIDTPAHARAMGGFKKLVFCAIEDDMTVPTQSAFVDRCFACEKEFSYFKKYQNVRCVSRGVFVRDDADGNKICADMILFGRPDSCKKWWMVSNHNVLMMSAWGVESLLPETMGVVVEQFDQTRARQPRGKSYETFL